MAFADLECDEDLNRDLEFGFDEDSFCVDKDLDSDFDFFCDDEVLDRDLDFGFVEDSFCDKEDLGGDLGFGLE